jgi:hypothetical protein
MSAVITVPRSRGFSRQAAWLVALAAAVTAAVLIFAMLARTDAKPAVPDPISSIYSGQPVTGTGPGLSSISNGYAPEAGPVTGTGPGLSSVANEYAPEAGPVTGTGPGLASLATTPAEASAGTPAQVHARNLAR